MYPGNQVVEKFQPGKRGANAFSCFCFSLFSFLYISFLVFVFFALSDRFELSKFGKKFADEGSHDRLSHSWRGATHACSRSPIGKSVAMDLDECREFHQLTRTYNWLLSHLSLSVYVGYHFFFSFSILIRRSTVARKKSSVVSRYRSVEDWFFSRIQFERSHFEIEQG